MAKSYKPDGAQAQPPRLFDSRVFGNAPPDVYVTADEYTVDAQAPAPRTSTDHTPRGVYLVPPGVLRVARMSSFAAPSRSSVV